MTQKEVTGNSQREFSTARTCLSKQIPFGENLAGYGDEGRPVAVVSLCSNKAVGAPSHSVTQVGRLWWDGCGLVGNQRGKALVGWWGSEVVFSGTYSTWRRQQVENCRDLSC